MLRVFSSTSRNIEIFLPSTPFDVSGSWYDLFNPSLEEIKAVEARLGVTIPTSEAMHEIEMSSRLYQDNDAFYMTLNLVASADSEHPISSPVTFILNQKQLITIRYIEPKPFQNFINKAQKNFKGEELGPAMLFLTLLEMIVDRVADIIESIGVEIDSISQEIFKAKNKEGRALKEIVTHIGSEGDLSAKVRLSLENINRLLKFISTPEFLMGCNMERYEGRIRILQQDVTSITDHLTFLFNKINFLLDATLGLISTEQNGVVKILSVAAVIFLPPTLIASIYGMNFVNIPELQMRGAYPVVLIIMILSAILPYIYFKRKGWLH